ncbi:GDP-mannose transporter [Strigomonas culicis]|uniref:GDP-mannose transporter n=1 Tax=Strigomonas culicis TaxID=28005 RepID=S9ULB6_9TRYP|nr:GDP-mannose transporter [Strigomonas culicis]|eukprot:EPY29544.1 GDP-mannose transporter [Strigomonas culicis]
MPSLKEYGHAIFMFTISSVGMMMTNKLAVSAFPLPCSLVFIQNIATLAILSLFARQISGINKQVLINWIPIALLFSVMLFTSLKSFVYVNVSTVVIMRNIGSIITTVVEYVVRGEKVNTEIVLSELAIAGGAYLYGYQNASLNWIGFFWVMINVIAQVAYGVTLKHYMASKTHFASMTKYTMSLLNNALCLPCILFLILVQEFGSLGSNVMKVDFMGFFWIALTCVIGFLISTSGFGLQKLVSATTFLVVNNLVKFFNIFLGFVFLGDQMGLYDGIGCFVALSAGAWYSSAIYNFQQAASHHSEVRVKTVVKETENDAP